MVIHIYVYAGYDKVKIISNKKSLNVPKGLWLGLSVNHRQTMQWPKEKGLMDNNDIRNTTQKTKH